MKNLMFGVVLAMLVSNIAAEDIKLITIADLDVRASYSSVTGSDASWSGTANLFALPALKLGASDYILPIINSSFTTSERVIEEETLFLHRWNNLFSLGWKHKINDGLDFKLSGDTRYNFNIETKDEVLGKGLYDL